MKRKSHLVALVAVLMLMGLWTQMDLVACHLEGEEEAEVAGEEAGSKVVGRGEDMGGGEEEVGREVGEVWREEAGEEEGWTGGVEGVEWKGEAGEDRQEVGWTGAGEGVAEVGWKEV